MRIKTVEEKASRKAMIEKRLAEKKALIKELKAKSSLTLDEVDALFVAQEFVEPDEAKLVTIEKLTV